MERKAGLFCFVGRGFLVLSQCENCLRIEGMDGLKITNIDCMKKLVEICKGNGLNSVWGQTYPRLAKLAMRKHGFKISHRFPVDDDLIGVEKNVV